MSSKSTKTGQRQSPRDVWEVAKDPKTGKPAKDPKTGKPLKVRVYVD